MALSSVSAWCISSPALESSALAAAGRRVGTGGASLRIDRASGQLWTSSCNWHSLDSPRQLPTPVRMTRIAGQASEYEKIKTARKFQMEATELLAALMKANDVRAVAQEHLPSLNEDFFVIASTYLEMAKKEANVEVVNKIESTLQTAMSVKEETLRPEIRLLNQLLREKDEKARSTIMQSNAQYLSSDSYFFTLLGMMTTDVEKQTNSPGRVQLLGQLKMISKESKEFTKRKKKSKGFGG